MESNFCDLAKKKNTHGKRKEWGKNIPQEHSFADCPKREQELYNP